MGRLRIKHTLWDMGEVPSFPVPTWPWLFSRSISKVNCEKKVCGFVQ